MGCNMTFLKRKDGSKAQGFQKRILMLGLDNAGKTSILMQLKQGEFVGSVPTVGLNVEHITYRNLSMTFWDVGGQARSLWKHYFQNTSGLIFVVDISDRERIELAKEELHKTAYDEALGKCPILLLLNKDDVQYKMSREEVFKELDLQSLFLANFRIIVQECSAKTKYGLWEGIAQLAGYLENSDAYSSGREQSFHREEPSAKRDEKVEGGAEGKSDSTTENTPSPPDAKQIQEAVESVVIKNAEVS